MLHVPADISIIKKDKEKAQFYQYIEFEFEGCEDYSP